HFHRVAVTQEQIRSMGLLTRPTKKTDSRSHNFEGESVEVDAIPPRELRALAATCITQHINPHTWEKLQETERQERESLQRVAQIMRQAA
ncbi:MAG TPA: hypothetical protein VK689_18390, partial [Armatimonadota bacterium]|nr:hypothetical protein [Armatimonadota bacterium]